MSLGEWFIRRPWLQHRRPGWRYLNPKLGRGSANGATERSGPELPSAPDDTKGPRHAGHAGPQAKSGQRRRPADATAQQPANTTVLAHADAAALVHVDAAVQELASQSDARTGKPQLESKNPAWRTVAVPSVNFPLAGATSSSNTM